MLRATIYIALFSVLSKILGLARMFAFANRFGAGQELDVYFAAFRVPDLFFNLLILGTLSVAFIPVFVGYLEEDRNKAFVLANAVFNITLLGMSAAALIGFIFAPVLVKLVAPGFDPEATRQTVQLTRILMLSPLLFSLSSVLTSILHSFKRFLIAAIAPLLYNISIIFGVLFLYPRFGFEGIVWSAVAGAFLHFAVQLPAIIRLGIPIFKHFDIASPGIKKIAKLFLPRILGLDLGQTGLLIASIIGSTIGAGSIAIYTIAFDLEIVPVGIFAIAFAVTAFPVLSELAQKNDFSSFKNILSKSIIQLLFLIIPSSVFMLILRAQLVRLMPGAGENTRFTFEDTRLTALALGFFAISLFAQSLIPLLARGFYALRNTVIPVTVGGLAILINAAAAILLRGFGPSYMALAFSIAVIVDFILLFLILRRRLGGDLNDDVLLLRVIKICIASVIAGTVSYMALYAIAPFVNMQAYWGVLLQGTGSLILGGLAYLFAGILIKLPEAGEFVNVIKIWFAKFSKPMTAAVENWFTDLR